MLLEIARGGDDGVALRSPERDRDHVGGHEVGSAHAQIEAFGDDVDQTALGHQIYMHLEMAAQEF
jgi:hypothetical protein